MVGEPTFDPARGLRSRPGARLPDNVESLATQIHDFEALASIRNTSVGGRQEGARFEDLIFQWWTALADHCEKQGAENTLIRSVDKQVYCRLSNQERVLYLPTREKTGERIPSAPDWLRTTYKVAEVVSAGNSPETISKYAPDTGQFAGEQYRLMYQGTSRKLNGAIALQENGKLIHMIMLECVSGKSSKKSRLDGNVCERLAFKFMECMEIARLHPSTTLCVLANGAFEKYRNIYHTMLQIMAERLRQVPRYEIRFVCSQKAYGVLASTLIDWLAGG